MVHQLTFFMVPWGPKGEPLLCSVIGIFDGYRLASTRVDSQRHPLSTRFTHLIVLDWVVVLGVCYKPFLGWFIHRKHFHCRIGTLLRYFDRISASLWSFHSFFGDVHFANKFCINISFRSSFAVDYCLCHCRRKQCCCRFLLWRHTWMPSWDARFAVLTRSFLYVLSMQQRNSCIVHVPSFLMQYWWNGVRFRVGNFLFFLVCRFVVWWRVLFSIKWCTPSLPSILSLIDFTSISR